MCVCELCVCFWEGKRVTAVNTSGNLSMSNYRVMPFSRVYLEKYSRVYFNIISTGFNLPRSIHLPHIHSSLTQPWPNVEALMLAADGIAVDGWLLSFQVENRRPGAVLHGWTGRDVGWRGESATKNGLLSSHTT